MMQRVIHRHLARAICAAALVTPFAIAQREIAFAIHYDPKTFDPAKVDEQASEQIRFLTGGVLLRMNRTTQAIEPALAASWSTAPDGCVVMFNLRPGLKFSDGSALTSADVVATLKRVLDPSTGSPVAEEFLDPTRVTVAALTPLRVVVRLPKRVVGIGKIFDEIAIQKATAQGDSRITAGPYVVTDYKRGEGLRLQRNPNYWRHDANGVQLPYTPSLRIDILSNTETEQLRFARGDYQLLNTVSADSYRVLAARTPNAVHDLGAALNTEQLWFNQAAAAPIPQWEKQWFASRNFRAAISRAIRRTDLARVAYDGHATPASGFVSPANTAWHNSAIEALPADTNAAMQLLQKDGFHKTGNTLIDKDGHAVTFSILTNAGNRPREKMAALIQQDLLALGIKVNLVTLDFPALIERLMHTQNYEAAMLGLSNVEPDPSSMMNVWLSSSSNHQWNPSEKTPATPWEAEIDRLMLQQATASSDKARKTAIDRVQAIVADQLPFIYLVYPNMLYAYAPGLTGVQLTVLQPGVLSAIETMRWNGTPR